MGKIDSGVQGLGDPFVFRSLRAIVQRERMRLVPGTDRGGSRSPPGRRGGPSRQDREPREIVDLSTRSFFAASVWLVQPGFTVGVNLVSLLLGELRVVLHRCSFDWRVGQATILPQLAHSARQRCCTSKLNSPRVLAETVEEAVDQLSGFWIDHPIPQVMRVDNATAFRGAIRHVAVIGRFLKFLLNSNVMPLFAAPYRSYTNPHIEGHHRTFTEKLWTQHRFTSLSEIDAECARFNAESEEFFRFKFAERLRAKSLRYRRSREAVNLHTLTMTRGKRIGFIRFVER